MSKRPAKYITYALYFLSLCLLISLGGWQLVRGLEKQAIEKQLVASPDIPTRVSRTWKNWGSLNHKNVELNGKWLPDRIFLMENRIYNGVAGHELFVPFILQEDNMVMLVNLGWSDQVQALPVFEVNSVGNVRIRGQLHIPEKGFTLGAAFTEQSAWPRRIQYFDHAELSRALGMDMASAVLIIDPGENQSLTRIWKPWAMDATRHFGYALQWWGLALVLIVFGVIWLRSGNQQKQSTD